MTDWLGWDAYKAAYPNTSLTSDTYPAAALQAELVIDQRTYSRAELVETTDTDTRKALAQLEGMLITRVAVRTVEDARSAYGAVQSASNDGYSEVYTARQELRTARQYEDAELVRQMLDFPDTRWLLYAGGVYHQFGRG